MAMAFVGDTTAVGATYAPGYTHMPSLQELTAALGATHRPAKPMPSIERVEGCYPATFNHPSVVICVLDLVHWRESLTIHLRAIGRVWKYFEKGSSLSPVCPQKLEATNLIRKITHFEEMIVTNAPREGVLTSQRALMRDRNGPMRLSCAYEISSGAENFTLMAYFSYVDSRYEIDEYDELPSD